MSKKNKDRVFLDVAAGVLIGVVVGGALTLLFAPKSGAQMRHDISDAIDDLKNKAEQLTEELQASATQVLDRSREAIEQTRENIIRSVEVGKETYLQKKEELTHQLES